MESQTKFWWGLFTTAYMSFKNQASECDLKYEEFDFFLSSVTPMLSVFGFYQVARSVFKPWLPRENYSSPCYRWRLTPVVCLKSCLAFRLHRWNSKHNKTALFRCHFFQVLKQGKLELDRWMDRWKMCVIKLIINNSLCC